MIREEFRKTLQEVMAILDGYNNWKAAIMERFDNERKERFEKLYFEKFPRRQSFTMEGFRKEFGDEFIENEDSSLTARYQEVIDEHIEKTIRAVRVKEKKLHKMAPDVPLSQTDTPRLHAEVSPHLYGNISRSRKCALAQAEIAAIPLSKSEARFEVRWEEEKKRYEVWAWVDDLDLQVANRLGVSAEDIVDICHKHVVDPRVFSKGDEIYEQWLDRCRRGPWAASS